MMKTQIGLGVLSIPVAFDALGIVPGVICLCAIGAITTWSDYVIGVFKLRHREVYGIDDVGGLLMGRWGKIGFGIAFVLCECALSLSPHFANHDNCMEMSLTARQGGHLSPARACWVSRSLLTLFRPTRRVPPSSFSLPPLSHVSSRVYRHWAGSLGWRGLACSAFLPPVSAPQTYLLGGPHLNVFQVMIVTVAVGIQDRPSSAPKGGVWVSDYKIVNSPRFIDAVTALTTIVFAYAGTPAFFSIAAEMREPRHYGRSLVVCQTVVTVFYLVIGIVVYYYCGSYVASPALGSAGSTVKIVSYAFALPGLLVSTLLFIHVCVPQTTIISSLYHC